MRVICMIFLITLIFLLGCFIGKIDALKNMDDKIHHVRRYLCE